MMYNYVGGWGSGMMLFGSITSVLVIAVLVLTIAALWKYINKK